VKTLELDDICANPHSLDSFLESGEPVSVVRSGKVIGSFVPATAISLPPPKLQRPDFRARFIQMWGENGINSTESIAEQFAALRSGRAA
jgi:hypothetical protein